MPLIIVEQPFNHLELSPSNAIETQVILNCELDARGFYYKARKNNSLQDIFAKQPHDELMRCCQDM